LGAARGCLGGSAGEEKRGSGARQVVANGLVADAGGVEQRLEEALQGGAVGMRERKDETARAHDRSSRLSSGPSSSIGRPITFEREPSIRAMSGSFFSRIA